jgi:hypothetical protein
VRAEPRIVESIAELKPRARSLAPSIRASQPEAARDCERLVFWTSKTMPDGTAWYVGFDDGRVKRDVKDDALWVRCVHDPVAP